MGTENPRRPSFPARPATTPFAAAQTMTPFSSASPVVGSEPPPFLPSSPSAPQTPMPFSSSGPAVGPGVSSFRPMPPGRFNDPSVPPPPTYNVPHSGGPFQRFPTPQFTSTAQAAPPHVPPMGQPPMQPSANQAPSFPASLQPQAPFVPMGSASQSATSAPLNSNVPSLSDSSFPGPRPNLQPSFPGYARKQTGADMQVPPMHSSFSTNKGNYAPAPPVASSPFLSHQGGYVPPPSVGAPPGMQQMQQPGYGPSAGATQGLMEDFSSLSIQTRPGTMDQVVDAKELPRPLDGDVEPGSLAEIYPTNCHPRYLRLTTGAIPSSQSLASRWHLPLGAVVSPLAEAPEGEEVPIVNFAPANVIRCRRCRTYVNPYVTFTDAGRKFRCNVCSLLNDGSFNFHSLFCYIKKRKKLKESKFYQN